ncbi:MAG: MCE family protein [Candidatus Schekmanbacteria bacterium]|nr:MCE family protein [Candidatus Schekmanbacteria bacterium]
MKNRGFKVETKVGLFTIGALVILVWLSMQFGEISWLKPHGYMLTADLDSVAGLEKESPVKLAGVRVGRVEDLTIKDGKAAVAMRIDDGVQIHKGSKVAVRSDSLLGQKYLELSYGDPSQAMVSDGESLGHGTSPADIDALVDQLTNVAKGLDEVVAQNKEGLNSMITNINDATKSLNRILVDNETHINSAIANIDSFSGRLNNLVAKNENSVTKAIKNFETLSTDLKEKAPEVIDQFSKVGKDLNGVISENRENLKETIVKVKETSENLNSILTKVNKGEGTLGKLVNDTELYDTAKKSLKELGDSAEQASELSPISTFMGSLLFLF